MGKLWRQAAPFATIMTANPMTAFSQGKPDRLGITFFGTVTITTALLAGGITGNWRQSALFSLASLPGMALADRWRIRHSQRQQALWQTSLQTTIRQQEVRLQELEHYEGQLHQAIAVAEQVNQSLQSDNQTLKSERFLLGQQVSGLKQRREQLSLQFASLQPQKRQLERELANLTQAVQATDLHKQTIEQNLRDSSQQLRQIEHSCLAIQGELGNLDKAIQTKQQRHQSLTEAIAVLEHHCQTLQDKRDTLSHQETQLIDQINSLGAQTADLQQTHGDLRAQITALTAQKQLLVENIIAKQQEAREMDDCLTYLRHEYDHLQAEIADRQGQALSLDQQLTPSGLS